MARAALGVGLKSGMISRGKPRRPGKRKAWVNKGKTSRSGNGRKLRY
jgi:hypothetical protein